MDDTIVGTIGIGTVLAMIESFYRNKSLFLAIIHGCLGWIYVVWSYLFHN